MSSRKIDQDYSNKDECANRSPHNLPYIYDQNVNETFSAGGLYQVGSKDSYASFDVQDSSAQSMHNNLPEALLSFSGLGDIGPNPRLDNCPNTANGLLSIPYLRHRPLPDDPYQVHPRQYAPQGLDEILVQDQPLYNGRKEFYKSVYGNKVNENETHKNSLYHGDECNSLRAVQYLGSAGHICTTHHGGGQESGFDQYYQDPAEPKLDGNEASTLIYRNFGESMDARGKRRREEFEKGIRLLPPGHDIPLETKQQRPYVKRLINAIGDTTNVIDKKTGKTEKDAQAVQRIKGSYYSPEIREQLSWELVNTLVSASVGVTLVDPFHQKSRRDREKYDSFVRRFEKIEELCKLSKAACKHFLDPEYIHRVVDAPGRELKQVMINGKLNGVRNVQNALGRKVMNGETENLLAFAQANSSTKSQSLSASTEEEEDDKQKKPAPPRHQNTTLKTPKSTESKGEQVLSETKKRSNSSKRKMNTQVLGSDKEDTPSKKEKPTTSKGVNQRTQHRTVVPSDGPPPCPETAFTAISYTDLGSALAMSSSQVPAVNISNADRQYRERICQILGVNVSYASYLGLEQLRLYARTFNIALPRRWQHNALPGLTGNGFFVQGSVGGIRYHLAELMPIFKDLAIERRDIDEDFIPTGESFQHMFKTENQFDNEALGTCPNPLGIFEQLCSADRRPG